MVKKQAVSLAWRAQGKRVAEHELTAKHVLARSAGEWLLDTSHYYLDGAEIKPSARAVRATSLDRYRDHVEAALISARAIQHQDWSHKDTPREVRSTTDPVLYITTVAAIIIDGWGIAIPHTTRGKRPEIDPTLQTPDAKRRRRRVENRNALLR